MVLVSLNDTVVLMKTIENKLAIHYPDDDNETMSINSFNNDNEWLVQVQSSKVKVIKFITGTEETIALSLLGQQLCSSTTVRCGTSVRGCCLRSFKF